MLNDRRHVEAIAIIRRLHESVVVDQDLWQAAVQWLAENQPDPQTYLNAIEGKPSRVLLTAERELIDGLEREWSHPVRVRAAYLDEGRETAELTWQRHPDA